MAAEAAKNTKKEEETRVGEKQKNPNPPNPLEQVCISGLGSPHVLTPRLFITTGQPERKPAFARPSGGTTNLRYAPAAKRKTITDSLPS